MPPFCVFSCNRNTWEKIHYGGKNGNAKTRIVDNPLENSHISGGKLYCLAIFPVGNSTVERLVIFRGNNFGGGGGAGR